ncbi:hypothetical protein HMSSN036_83340 [Paenibacillus macerans]|nr:hypothetical protein HMSSN036_83340 [Paenibacillus macerans]
MELNQENQEIRVIRDAPSVQDYVKLREQAGLSPRSAEGAEVGLRNSLFAVSLYDPEGLVGMGRVIGDGGCFMQVVDIAVRPDAQGQGLGSRIVGEIVGYLETSAPPLAYVSLIADRRRTAYTGSSVLNTRHPSRTACLCGSATGRKILRKTCSVQNLLIGHSPRASYAG